MGFFSFFSKEKKETLDKGLSKTKESVFGKIARAVAGKSKVDDEVLDNLEEVLITSDVGVETTLNIIKRIENRVAKDKYVKYGGPVLVLDFGTATTYDLITADGRFTAGITAPGIRISSEALWKETAKLPNIEIRKPKTILAQETITSMQAGLMYGQIGQTEYIIRKVKEESGLANLKVVATGGLGRAIADETDSIDIYDSSLTLDGLRIIYDKNRK